MIYVDHALLFQSFHIFLFSFFFSFFTFQVASKKEGWSLSKFLCIFHFVDFQSQLAIVDNVMHEMIARGVRFFEELSSFSNAVRLLFSSVLLALLLIWTQYFESSSIYLFIYFYFSFFFFWFWLNLVV